MFQNSYKVGPSPVVRRVISRSTYRGYNPGYPAISYKAIYVGYNCIYDDRRWGPTDRRDLLKLPVESSGLQIDHCAIPSHGEGRRQKNTNACWEAAAVLGVDL